MGDMTGAAAIVRPTYDADGRRLTAEQQLAEQLRREHAAVTVAANATDADDCRMLLEMLGLSGIERRRTGTADLDIPAEYVPIDDVRMLVERIQRDTGKSVREIGRLAGLDGRSLANRLTPSHSERCKRIVRSTYTALRRYAEELSA